MLDRVRAAGFALAGIAPAEPSAFGKSLEAWLAASKNGEMDYLAQDQDIRLEPAKIMAGTRAFVMVADQYAVRGDSHEPSYRQGRIARYAMGRNYHQVMKKRLHAVADQLRIDYPGSDFRTFVDTAPIMERELAAQAGIGWQGKNTLIINSRLGSYFLLGGMATTLPLVAPDEQAVAVDHCGTCTRCIDACPTGAITPYSVDGSRCVSYLTIEHRSVIDPALAERIGDWIYGCDVCQDVCPHNSSRSSGTDVGAARPEYTPRQRTMDLLRVIGWDVAEREEAKRTTAMKRATLAMMKRNAVIAIWNEAKQHGDSTAIEHARNVLAKIVSDDAEPELVRRTAREALNVP